MREIGDKSLILSPILVFEHELNEFTRIMAKKDKEPIEEMPQTMEDYLLAQLNDEVVLKDGTKLQAPDGHVMTKQEAIATNLINLAMKGDTKAAQYIQNIQLRAQMKKK